MRFLGDIDLTGNQLKNVTLEPVENYPADSRVGSFIFKDKRVMVCVELADGVPFWAPLTSQLNTHIHDQHVAATVWTIDHALNSSATMVQVLDTDGKHITPDEVVQVMGQTVITFYSAQAGRAILMLGQEEGYQRSPYTYQQRFSVASTTWVVDHALGYEPIVRVFVDELEMQPSSITHDSLNRTTITFSVPTAGIVRTI